MGWLKVANLLSPLLQADSSAQPAAPTKLNQVQDQVNDVQVILKDNINKVLERGEKLDDLIDKTDDLQATVSLQIQALFPLTCLLPVRHTE